MRKCIGNIVIEDGNVLYQGMPITMDNVGRFVSHVNTMLSVLEPGGCLTDMYKSELNVLNDFVRLTVI